jgi:hypothetical protein
MVVVTCCTPPLLELHTCHSPSAAITGAWPQHTLHQKVSSQCSCSKGSAVTPHHAHLTHLVTAALMQRQRKLEMLDAPCCRNCRTCPACSCTPTHPVTHTQVPTHQCGRLGSASPPDLGLQPHQVDTSLHQAGPRPLSTTQDSGEGTGHAPNTPACQQLHSPHRER